MRGTLGLRIGKFGRDSTGTTVDGDSHGGMLADLNYKTSIPMNIGKIAIVLLATLTLGTAPLFAQKKNGTVVEKKTSNVGDYIRTANYTDDVLNGPYSEVFEKNGKNKTSGKYLNGKKTGAWEYGKADGTKTLAEVYDNAGNVIKKTTYYSNGTPEIERDYKDGRYHGVSKKYAQDGTLKSEENFVDGKEHGKQTLLVTNNTGNYTAICNYQNGLKDGEYSETFANGNRKVTGRYKQDKKDGAWVYGEASGKQTREETYADGKLTGTRKL